MKVTMNYFKKIIGTGCFTMLITAAFVQAGEIHTAAAAGDLKKVKALIVADPTLLESRDNDGNTPLISACFAPPTFIPQAAVANFLIDKGANVNARNNSGASPLYFAINDFDLMQRLTARGADVNVQAYGGLTPLIQAASSGNLKVVRLLIDHGADLNVRSQEGTILHRIINKNCKSNVEMAKLLIESGAKLQEFSYRNTELHLAAINGYTDLIRLLVEHSADINAVNDYNHTAIYYAARHGHRKTADALIVAGANTNTIVETNYGKAPQLTATLKEGEAWLWYLGGGSPCDGYAVKTKNHLLIFNPSGISESPEAGLANGYLNPNELAGQKITVLINHRSGDQYAPTISELAKAMPGANFVLNFKPADSADNRDIPLYRLAAPNESFSIDGVQVHTIPAMLKLFFEGEGLGYLVEADGVKIFHAGLHVSDNDAPNVAKFRKEVDFLKPFGPIDIAILPINGRHIFVAAYEPYLYLIDQLSPKAIYLIGDDLSTEEHLKCIEVLRARNIPVKYPEGGIAMGERFHYLRDKASIGQLPIGEPVAATGATLGGTAENPPPALDVTYLANEGFMVCAAGKKVLIDALFDPEFAAKVGPPAEILKAIKEGREPFNEIDLILVTHKDADHFHAAGVIACLQSNPRCRLVAHTQVVDLMRPIDGFAAIAHQIREIKLEAGAHEQVSHNGVGVDVLCLLHEHRPQTINLAFVVGLGGAHFIHMGDAFFAESEAHLKSYPFGQTHTDLLFLNQYDSYGSAPELIADRIKPSHIVAMHVMPAEFADASTKLHAVYPGVFLFEKSMEHRVFASKSGIGPGSTLNTVPRVVNDY
jgi:ankyrin repeat protein/L-ascorbate metabolism protein UlaG (beta-lactamase superfamily)